MKKTLLLMLMPAIAGILPAQVPVIEWAKIYGGSDYDDPNAFSRTADHGYILANTTSSDDFDVTASFGMADVWIVKTDSLGNVEWKRSYGGSSTEVAKDIKQTPDGGYIFAGYTYSTDGDITSHHGSSDFWVVKLDPAGNIEWQKTFGGSEWDDGMSVVLAPGGGYTVFGSTYSTDGDIIHNNGTNDFWVLKLDENGTIQWQKCYGGSSTETAYKINNTYDGGYVLCGGTWSDDGDVSGFHGFFDGWVVKIDSTGNLQWQKALGGNSYDVLYSVEQSADSGYVVAGATPLGLSYAAWLLKLDPNGSTQWNKKLGGSRDDCFLDVHQAGDGGFIASGYTYSINGDVTGNPDTTENSWIVKTNALGVIEWQGSFGGTEDDCAVGIIETTPGKYTVAGYAGSEDGDILLHYGAGGVLDVWLFHLDLTNVGIENENENIFRLYPNPSDGEIWVEADPAVSIGETCVINSFGQVIKQQVCQGNLQKIMLNDLAPGIYFISLDIEGKKYTKKLVLKGK